MLADAMLLQVIEGCCCKSITYHSWWQYTCRSHSVKTLSTHDPDNMDHFHHLAETHG